MVKIFIDPGHGGADPGAVANGLKEKNVCLTIGMMLRDILNEEYVGHQVKLSRKTDITLTLKERTDMANGWGADYLVSIHVNAGGGSGFESYIYNGSYADKARTSQLRNIIHDKIVQDSGYRDRGKKEANFHMLRDSRMPAILTENGFIDTASDASLLKDLDFLYIIARGHAHGISKAFGLKKKNKGLEDPAGSWGHEKGRGMKKSELSNWKGMYKYHGIQRGDTLWSLAKRYGTTVEKLKEWNQSVIPKQLQIGQQLIVDVGVDRGTYHTIEKGDTLWEISSKYGTTVARLIELNGGIDPKRLQIGKRIRIG